jgi:tetratricopeptide (TPR) repeat protein
MSKRVCLAAAFAAFLTGLAAQDQPQKRWRDRGEFDLAEAAQQAEPQDRLPILDRWAERYLLSENADVRDDLYLLTYQQMKDCRKAFNKAVTIFRTRPNNFLALSAIDDCIQQIDPPELAYLDEAEAATRYLLLHLDAVFAEGNNPPTIPHDRFQQSRQSMQAFAQRTLGYIYMQKKDHAKAEVELRKALELDPTQTQFAYYLAGELLAQQRQRPVEAPSLVLFYYARAAAYDGPNSMSVNARKAALDFLTRAYGSYHGSRKGLEELLELARSHPFPPEGFRIDTLF